MAKNTAPTQIGICSCRRRRPRRRRKGSFLVALVLDGCGTCGHDMADPFDEHFYVYATNDPDRDQLCLLIDF